ncbi:hypothetical protein [Nonomuraea sp. NPDC050783]|uniref:hypothetical protein n=1 Tax=Nonomuraea sp. NPDC050783 TaxID=3154634 RepID=UPI00346733B7
MPAAGFHALYRGPVADERVFTRAEALLVAERAGWGYPAEAMAEAVARFRRVFELAGTVVCAGWYLPHGFRPPPPDPAASRERRRGYDPTLGPGAIITWVAVGHRVRGDLRASTAAELARPVADGSVAMLAWCGPVGRMWTSPLPVMRAERALTRALALLPRGVEVPQVLGESRWRRAGQVVDDLSGRPLDVHEGPAGPSDERVALMSASP